MAHERSMRQKSATTMNDRYTSLVEPLAGRARSHHYLLYTSSANDDDDDDDDDDAIVASAAAASAAI